MTKEELVARLRDIESFDFEANVLKSDLLMNLCQVSVFYIPTMVREKLDFAIASFHILHSIESCGATTSSL